MRRFAWLVLLGWIPVFAATTARPAGRAIGVMTPGTESPLPAHPVTAAQVHEILKLTGTGTQRREMLDGLLPHLKQMMPWMPADVVTDLESTLGSADFEGAMVRSFQRHLSTEEAAQIIAFYRTRTGRHMIVVMPTVLNEGQEAAGALGQEVMLEVMQRHKDEIDAAARVYHEEHRPSEPGRP